MVPRLQLALVSLFPLSLSLASFLFIYFSMDVIFHTKLGRFAWFLSTPLPLIFFSSACLCNLHFLDLFYDFFLFM